MDILKKAGLVLLSPVFTFLLFATALDVGFVRTATHPQAVKDLVAESGIYKTIVPNLLQQNKTIPTPVGNITTDDPQIKQAVDKAIPPQSVQRQTDAAIDDVYAWLDGKTQQPDFSFGLSDQKDQFADGVAAAVSQRLQNLPACSTAQSLAIARSGSFDAVNASCLPRGVTPDAAAQTVKSAVLNSDYLSKANINASDIKDSTGRSVFQTKLKDAPNRYRLLKKTPFILTALTILAGIAIIFLSATWRKGLRHVGITVLFAGLIMLLFAWGVNKAVNESLPNLHINNAVLDQSVNNLVKEVARKITGNYTFFGWLYAAIGITAAAAGFYLVRRGSRQPEAPAGSVPAADIEGGRQDPGDSRIDGHGY